MVHRGHDFGFGILCPRTWLQHDYFGHLEPLRTSQQTLNISTQLICSWLLMEQVRRSGLISSDTSAMTGTILFGDVAWPAHSLAPTLDRPSSIWCSHTL